jgi:siroheme synthase-like protein
MRLPTVLNIEGPVVIFGGGNVGLRKVEYLSNFTEEISVIGEDILPMPEFVTIKRVRVDESSIEGHLPDNTSLVVSALSEKYLNKTISQLCKRRNIPVNVVDDPELSTLLFPALSVDGDLTIAVSTSGRCPFLASEIRKELDESVSEKGAWLEVLAPIREELDGAEDKKVILSNVYGNQEIAALIKKGDLENAKKKAREVLNVHR